MDSLTALRSAFAPVPGYLDAATCGLPARATVDAMRDALDTWQAGKADLAVYDEAVAASRAAFARLVGVDPSWVAIGSQTSALVGLVAASVPDGAEVLVVDGDFASVVFPFLAHADRGVTVRQVPLESLADEVRPSTHTVAFSLVQSRDGRVADVDADPHGGRRGRCRDRLRRHAGRRLAARRRDRRSTSRVCASYKWLSAPRGTAFLTVRPDVLDRLRPTSAGWYAGEEIWSSVYGPHMALATRRPPARRVPRLALLGGRGPRAGARSRTHPRTTSVATRSASPTPSVPGSAWRPAAARSSRCPTTRPVPVGPGSPRRAPVRPAAAAASGSRSTSGTTPTTWRAPWLP